METFTIPDYFDPEDDSCFRLIDYRTVQECTRQQVNLSMNTFSFLQEGQKEVIFGTQSQAISNDRFLLMKAGKCLMTEKMAAARQSYHSVLFCFRDEEVVAFARKHGISMNKGDSTLHPPFIDMIYTQFSEAFVASLLQVKAAPPETRQKLMAVKFEEIMLYLTSTFGPQLLSLFVLKPQGYKRHFQNVVENNKLNKLSLAELSFLANMSLSTFKREFEKQYKTSPGKWFQKQRLEHAALRLRNDGLRPSDVFEDAGYDSLSNFIQAFKAEFGTTPKQHQLT